MANLRGWFDHLRMAPKLTNRRGEAWAIIGSMGLRMVIVRVVMAGVEGYMVDIEAVAGKQRSQNSNRSRGSSEKNVQDSAGRGRWSRVMLRLAIDSLEDFSIGRAAARNSAGQAALSKLISARSA